MAKYPAGRLEITDYVSAAVFRTGSAGLASYLVGTRKHLTTKEGFPLRSFSARYGGRCSVCGKVFPVSTKIVKWQGRPAHVLCVSA